MFIYLIATLWLTASAQRCPANCDSANWGSPMAKFQAVCAQCVNAQGWCGTAFCSAGTDCARCTSSTTAQNVCPSGYDDWVDTDFVGNDIGGCGAYSTVAEIATACDLDPSCQGFSVLDQSTSWGGNLGPWCMKSNVGASNFAADHHFCMKKGSVAGFGTPTPVWSGSWSSSTSAPVSAPMGTPAPSVAVTCPSGFTAEADMDYNGYDIGGCGNVKTMKKAAQFCLSDPNCLGFTVIDEAPTFSGPSVGDPWCFKSVADSTNSSPRTDHHFCRRDSPPVGSFTPAPITTQSVVISCPSPYIDQVDTDYNGNDISCGQYKTLAKAQQACDADPTCVGFSVQDQAQAGATVGNPWCLKNAAITPSTVVDHHFCMKPGMGPSPPTSQPSVSVTCPQGFQDEVDMDYNGFDIGACGAYSTVADAGVACQGLSNCEGFSVIDQANWGVTIGEPWCLKHVANATNANPRQDHHFCRKVSTPLFNCQPLSKKACKKNVDCDFDKKAGVCMSKPPANNSCHDPQFDGKKFKGKVNKQRGGKTNDNCGCAAMCANDAAWNFDPKKGKCACFSSLKSKKGVPKTGNKNGLMGNTI